jgi:hypothetical protein
MNQADNQSAEYASRRDDDKRAIAFVADSVAGVGDERTHPEADQSAKAITRDKACAATDAAEHGESIDLGETVAKSGAGRTTLE